VIAKAFILVKDFYRIGAKVLRRNKIFRDHGAAATFATAEAARADTVVTVDGITFTLQTGWKCCGNCFALYWASAGGVCAYRTESGEGSEPHVQYTSTVYGVATAVSSTSNIQSPWRYCSGCACLYWGNALSSSHCADEATPIVPGSTGEYEQHTAGNTVYYLPYGTWTGDSNLQAGWRYCDYCRVLFWGGQIAHSWCPLPANGSETSFAHVTAGSVASATNYNMFITS